MENERRSANHREPVTFFVPMCPPRTTHQTKSVRCVNGKPHHYEGQALAAARAKLMSAFAPHAPDKPLHGAVRASLKILFPTDKPERHGKYRETKPDLDNSEKLIFDCLEALGFFAIGDQQIASKHTEKLWTAEHPGIWMRLEEIETQPS